MARNVRSEAFEAFPSKPSKDFYLCSTQEIDSLTGQVNPSSQRFGLFLALDARSLDDVRISNSARSLLERGLAYLCIWGLGCERVHDTFDGVAAETDPEGNRPVVMTTWHSDETLQEALWFFVNRAFPDAAYVSTCKQWIVASLGHPDWEIAIRDVFASIGSQQTYEEGPRNGG